MVYVDKQKQSEAIRRSERKRRARMRRIIVMMKVTLGCACCGYADHPDALQFDHIDPVGRPSDPQKTKRWRGVLAGCSTYSKLWRIVLDDGVQVLCSNCHSIKSAEEHRERPFIN